MCDVIIGLATQHHHSESNTSALDMDGAAAAAAAAAVVVVVVVLASNAPLHSLLGPVDCSDGLKRLHSTLCYMFRTELRATILSRLFAFRDAFTSRSTSASASLDFGSLSTDLWTANHTSRPLFSVSG